MTSQLVKDVLLFRLDLVELRQLLDENSMIHSVWTHLQADVSSSGRRKGWIPHPWPLKICHEEHGRGHYLQCRLFLWRYFREVTALNSLEREIRAQILALGISGEADRRTARYAAPLPMAGAQKA